MILYLKYAPWPNARACLDKLIYAFIDLANTSQLTKRVLLQRRPEVPVCSSVESEDHLDGKGCVIGDRDRVAG